MSNYQIICGDSRKVPLHFQNQVDLIVTSPPYADARKQHYESIDPEHYSEWFSSFHESFWQALKPTGSLVINIKGKVVGGVRHRYVWKTIECLTALGWYCIDDYIWHKKTAMPGYWPSRLRDAWEYVFHLAKCKQPYMDQQAARIPIAKATRDRLKRLRDPDRKLVHSETGSGFARDLSHWVNKEIVLPTNVLYLSTESRNRQHPAAFPIALPSFFIQLLSPRDGLVMDPFAGSGTTGEAALRLGRRVILIDSNADYCSIAHQRLNAHKQRIIL